MPVEVHPLQGSVSGPGLLVDPVPVVYQRSSDSVQPCLFVMIFMPLITNYFLRRPSITGSERLVPAAVAEFGRRDVRMLQEKR